MQRVGVGTTNHTANGSNNWTVAAAPVEKETGGLSELIQ